MPPDDREDRIRIGELSPGDVALLKDVADAAAEATVRRMLIAMGLDPNNPINAQEDFSLMRYVNDKVRDPEFKQDLAWVRRARKASEGIFGKIMLTAVGIAVAGGLTTFWQGLKAVMRTAPPG
jgi:hypothetical protein